MALSDLPLSYCTNVHPGRSLSEVEQGLDQYTTPLRANYGAPLAAGLWLASPVAAELLAEPRTLPAFREGLARRRLMCHTLNAFPYGDFHSRRVKENVYLPDWADSRRLKYTIDCAHILAALLPDAVEGSISTMPLAFKGFDHAAAHFDQCLAHFLDAAVALDRLFNETGRLIRLAIEPEPLCLVETTAEAVAFFERLWASAAKRGVLNAVRPHLGLCYDVCHQAVEFEDIRESIRALATAGVRINKVHITCAIELESPASNAAGRRALADYVEERYLHQTLARTRDGKILRQTDLSERLALDPPADFREALLWRVHYHVPVNCERLGPLRTTRTELHEALSAISELEYAPHLEVETYTWEVLPESERRATANLVEGLTGELTATRDLLETISIQNVP